MTQTLPKLPADFEWVIAVEADRTHVSLYQINPKGQDEEVEDDDIGEVAAGLADRNRGFIKRRTFKHPALIDREEWEAACVTEAETLYVEYLASNRHAAWADDLMRRSR
jgi:hypothetical protein